MATAGSNSAVGKALGNPSNSSDAIRPPTPMAEKEALLIEASRPMRFEATIGSYRAIGTWAAPVSTKPRVRAINGDQRIDVTSLSAIATSCSSPHCSLARKWRRPLSINHRVGRASTVARQASTNQAPTAEPGANQATALAPSRATSAPPPITVATAWR